MKNQVYLFVIFILNGFLISILFDFFRILRKSFKTKDFTTYTEDILFWILTAFIILYSIFKFSDGELRAFIFVGIALGVILYMLLFSKYIMKFSLIIVNFLKKLVNFIFIIPMNFILAILKKTILRPIIFLLKKVKKILSFFKINYKCLYKNKKKDDDRKDFV